MNASAGLAREIRPQQEIDELQLWMESLASGEWSADDFLREVIRLEKHDRGLPWDVLTMLEQHYHRELIDHELFVCVRARLQKHLFEVEKGSEPVPAEESPDAVAAVPEGEGTEAEGTEPDTLHAGDLIRGRYRVAEILDRNTWGTMVEAVDEHRVDVPDVRQRVSMYVIDGVRAQESALLQRVFRLQSLSHPCIQKVFDVDEHQGRLFVTMEWLGGITVHQLLDLNGGQRLSAPAARTIVRAVASALAYAHARDVCHGSLDTRSVVATDSGEIKLRGFELSGLHFQGDPSVDRRAFAGFAYRMLGGVMVPEGHLGPRARRAALRQPVGLPRGQWEVLRNALLGKDSPSLLTLFAGEGDIAAGRYTLLHALPAEVTRRSIPAWIAAGAVAASVVAAGIFFVEPFGMGASRAGTSATPAVAAVSQTVASPPVAVAKPLISSATAAQPVASTPVATRREVLPERQRARIELAASTVEAPAEEPFALVHVRRRDNLQGPVSFKWWTETGSAQANRDFLGIEPRLEWIPSGSQSVVLRVPLLADPTRNQPRTFYVKIEPAGSNAGVLGSRTLTQVSIRPATVAISPTGGTAGRAAVAALP